MQRLSPRAPAPRPHHRPQRIALALLAAPLVLALASCTAAPPPTPFDARIAFHEQKLRDDPGLYAVRAELGESLLERARYTHDPRDVRRARAELLRSVETQPNFQAYKAMTALCNFAHRFEDALSWADLAAAAYPEDTGVTAQRVEALLGLGRIEDAASLVRERAAPEPDFYLSVAEGRILAARDDADGAVEAFGRAAQIAQRFDARQLALWAHVSAAAALIDAGRAAQAEPHLDAAAAIEPLDPFLRVHQAEFLAANDRTDQAIEMYETLLTVYADPVLHAAAASLHRQAGDARQAHRHYRAAERGFQRAIDAGEVYTLESLARLYVDAGTKLDRARRLAERNLDFKRDEPARRLLQALEAR